MLIMLSHKINVLKEILAEACVDVGFLPPNDSVFASPGFSSQWYGPFKAHIRHLKA